MNRLLSICTLIGPGKLFHSRQANRCEGNVNLVPERISRKYLDGCALEAG